MTTSFRRWITTDRAWLLCLAALIVSAEVLLIITFVAGQSPHSLQGLPMLSFDTSSVRAQLADQDISNAGHVQDWYEPHYLSVCKGMWQSALAQLKNESSTVCTKMAAGYRFSLPELLATDAGIAVNSTIFSTWSFAVFPTQMPFVCLTLALVFLNWTLTDYLFVIVRTPKLTCHSPLHSLRVAYIISIVALNVMVAMSARLTSLMEKVLKAKVVDAEGVAWSTGGFYALIWVATGVMCVEVILSVIFACKLRRRFRVPEGDFDRKDAL